VVALRVPVGFEFFLHFLVQPHVQEDAVDPAEHLHFEDLVDVVIESRGEQRVEGSWSSCRC